MRPFKAKKRARYFANLVRDIEGSLRGAALARQSRLGRLIGRALLTGVLGCQSRPAFQQAPPTAEQWAAHNLRKGGVLQHGLDAWAPAPKGKRKAEEKGRGKGAKEKGRGRGAAEKGRWKGAEEKCRGEGTGKKGRHW